MDEKEIKKTKDAIKKSVNEISENIQRETKKVHEAIAKQSKMTVEDIMDDVDNMFDDFGEGIDMMDDKYQDFFDLRMDEEAKESRSFIKRMKDRIKYNKYISKAFKGTSRLTKEFFEDFRKNMGSVADVVNGMQISDLKSSLNETGATIIENMRSIRKSLGVTSEKFRDTYEKDIHKIMEEVNSEYGGKVRSTEVVEQYKKVVEAGIKDRDLAKRLAKQRAVAKSVIGEMDEDFSTQMTKAMWQGGYLSDEKRGDMILRMTNILKDIEDNTDTAVTAADLSKSMAEGVSGIQKVAGTDAEKFEKFFKEYAKATAIEGSMWGTSNNAKVIADIFTKSMSQSDFVEKFSSLGIVGTDVNKIYAKSVAGDMQGAMSDLIAGQIKLAKHIESMDADVSAQMKKNVMDSMGLSDEEYKKFATSDAAALEGLMKSLKNAGNSNKIKTAIDNTYVSFLDRLKEYIVNTRVGRGFLEMKQDIGDAIGDSFFGQAALFSAVKFIGGKVYDSVTKKGAPAIAESVKDIFSKGVGALKDKLAPKAVESLSKFGPKLFSKVGATLGFAIDSFLGVFKAEDWFGEGASAIQKIESSLAAAIGGTGSGIMDSSTSFVDKIFDIITNAIKGAAVGSAIPGIGTAVGAVAGAVTGAIGGKNIATALDKVTTFLNPFNHIPSHANGLDRVPYDGYIAELHEGEAVVPKKYNTAGKRADGTSAGGYQASVSEESLTKSLTKVFGEDKVLDEFADNFIDSLFTAWRKRRFLAQQTMGGMFGFMGGSGGGGSFAPSYGGGTVNPRVSMPSMSPGKPRVGYSENPSDLARQAWAEAQRIGKELNTLGELIYGQWYHETGGFSSRLALEDFNFGGLTTTKNMGPAYKQPDGSLWYMSFPSIKDYADYYKRIWGPDISGAQSVEEYAANLKRDGYYGDSYENYVAGMYSGMQHIPSPSSESSTPSYDVGTPWLPNDQVALLHKGEAILPASANPFNNMGSTMDLGEAMRIITEIASILRNGFQFLGKKMEDSAPQMGGMPELPPVLNQVQSVSHLFFEKGGF